MRLLVIGGTVFVGRAVVEAALARGFEVMVFHRGRHGRGLFGGRAEHVLGDRSVSADLERLAAVRRGWDVVVDTCGFEPRHVEASARALAGRTGRYVFVSTAGVYRDWPVRPVVDEDAPLHEEGQGYSELKAACERAAEAVLSGRLARVRPGIVGPHENIGRLPWWLRRMARGGRILAPGPRDAPMQLVDARDLAEFCLDVPPGAWNAISAPGAFTWGEFLETARDVAAPARSSALVWTDPERVAAAVPDSWGALPLWPAPVADMAAVYAVGTDRARAAGLRIRSLRETMADTWSWLQAPGAKLGDWRRELQVSGLDEAREVALLGR